nr:hypothetical protein [Tanacetum cinerariifolium]
MKSIKLIGMERQSKSIRYHMPWLEPSQKRPNDGAIAHPKWPFRVLSHHHHHTIWSRKTPNGGMRPTPLHKNIHKTVTTATSFPSNRLNARRSAMTNSLVRIGTVEGGDLVKRALSALIRPSSHQQRRRTSFQRVKSRLLIGVCVQEWSENVKW